MRQPGTGLTERGLGVVGAAAAVALLAAALAAPSLQPVLAQSPAAPASSPAASPPAPTPPASPPQEDQRPVFRGGTAFVAVDAYPRRDGKVVEGLTAADFEVTEDGKPQSVETFQFIRFETTLEDAERRDPTSIADSERQAADPRNRLFVIYLDPYHATIEGGVNTASTVMAFLTRTIGATDMFATMTPELPPSQLTFGRRLETLESDLRDFWRDIQMDPTRLNYPRTEAEQKLAACVLDVDPRTPSWLLARHRQDVMMTSLEGLARRLGGLKDERKNILFISEGWGPLPAIAISSTGGRGGIPPIGVGPTGRLGMGNQQPNSRDDTWCDLQTGRLGNIDFEDRFRNLLELARQSNVTFYPVDVGGLRVSQNSRNRNTLLELAENTDGIAITNTNDTAGAVRRLTDSIAAYYLLGYYSSNPASDGKFRRIRVRIKQPNVDVSARPGYFAPTAAMLAASKAPPPPPATAVDVELGRLSRARAEAELHSYAVHNGARLDVVAELASRLMERPDWKTGADVRVTVQPPSGAPIEARGRIEAGTRSVVVPVAIAADDRGPWKITLRVSSNDALLDISTSAAPSAGPIFGEPMLFRANPSPRAVARAVADLQYRRIERIHVEWRALKPLTGRTVRLLDRQGQPLPVTPTLSDRDDAGVTVVSADITLAPLREGDYVIELTGTSGTETERELLAFKVVR